MVHIATDASTKPRVVGLYVQGQLDLTAVGAFRESLTRATRTNRAVEIHLGNVDFIDGCGLATLIDAMTRARGAGHEMSIVDASGCVRRLIELTDTADRLAPLPGEWVGERRRPSDGEELTRMVAEATPSAAFRA